MMELAVAITKNLKLQMKIPKKFISTMKKASDSNWPKNAVGKIVAKMGMKNVAQTVVVKMTTMKKKMTRKNLVVAGTAAVVAAMMIN